ncbi:MAG: pectate lyase [Ignavibacteria bacterium]|nr:pectate lyase [Ignavibacteria bacterium]
MILGVLSGRKRLFEGVWCALLTTSVLVSSFLSTSPAQSTKSIYWWACLAQQEQWYGSPEAIRIADNLLLYQYPSGGWPKNIDMAEELNASQKERLKAQNHLDSSTIDNTATYTQLRYLAKVYNSTKLERFRESFLKGLDYLLAAQYPNGGWPQFYPLREGYYSHITFNDDAMIGVMKLLRDIAEKKSAFAFIDSQRRVKAELAVAKGLQCILKCQIRVDGMFTVWCAQHDEHDFSAAKARTYELPSLSGNESVGVLEFLMGVEKPSDEIKNSIQSAVAWFNKVRIQGIRVIEVNDTLKPARKDKVIIKDPSAPHMWARFYEIGTNRPFFCSRDGIKRDNLFEISYERRNHYNWLDYWPQRLLEKEYPGWARKHSLNNVLE